MSELRITSIDPFVVANPWKPWIFVRVETNRGLYGIGEAKGLTPEEVVAALGRFEDELVGADPFETDRLFTPIFPAGTGAAPDNGIHTTALAAVDIACWDLKGKHLDVPLYDLLGGRVHDGGLRTYANGWYTDVYDETASGPQPEKFAAAAEEVVAEGYDAMKFDPFGDAWRGMDRSELNDALEIVGAVRDAVGPDVDLLIEGHRRFDAAVGIEIAHRLAEYDVGWFEEPTPPETKPLRRVAGNSPVPVATGESLRTHHAFTDLLTETDVGVVQPDLVNTGGVTQLQRIATMADAERIRVAPHNAQSPLSTAVTAHVDVTMPNFMIQEVFEDFAHPDWAPTLFDEPPTIEDGQLQVPEGPGIGVDLNLDAVREHAYTDGQDDVKIIDVFQEGWEGRSFDE